MTKRSSKDEADSDSLQYVADIKEILNRALQLGDRFKDLGGNSRLLGTIPEFDSMAVVTVITAIEDNFGIMIDDDELSADTFATVNSLAQFVREIGKFGVTIEEIDTEAIFVNGVAGKLFFLYFCPASRRPTKAVLYFPPFSEEMNKSRRMARLQAERFARLGYCVLLIDLYGTGDSEGEFGNADWDIWSSDMIGGVEWLRSRGVTEFVFWGLRLGAALALSVISRKHTNVSKMLFWQPITNGQLAMKQFLRLRLAANMFAGRGNITMKDLEAKLCQDNSIEVAGYELNPNLYNRISSLQLELMIREDMPRISWMEVVSGPDSPMSLTSQKTIEKIRSAGVNVDVTSIAGDPFWSTAEVSTLPKLLVRTSDQIGQA